jgi:hypothetical protein
MDGSEAGSSAPLVSPCVRVVGFASLRREAGSAREWRSSLTTASPIAASSPLTRRLRDAALSPAPPPRGEPEGKPPRAESSGELLAIAGASGSDSEEHREAPEDGEQREERQAGLAGSVPVGIPGDRRRCVRCRRRSPVAAFCRSPAARRRDWLPAAARGAPE